MNRFSLAMNPLVCARFGGMVFLLPGLLSGSLASPAGAQSVFSDAVGAGILRFDSLPNDVYPLLMDSGDYNNDGLKDLLFGYSQPNDEMMVAIGQGDGQFELVGPFISSGNYEALSAGDIDGDGSIEFVMRENFNVSVLSSASNTTQVEEPAGVWYLDDDLFDPTFRSQVYSGDLDGDGGTDFVFNTTEQRVLVRWSSWDQGDPYETVLMPEIGDQNMIFPIEDYDGDGDLDILVYDEDSTKFVLVEGNGTNTMGTVRVIEQAYPRIAAGDRPLFGQFDDDPAMDLVIHDLPASTAGIVLGFANAGSTLVDISVGEQVIPIGVEGDLDGSGAPDIVVLRTSVLPPAASADVQGALFVDPLGGGGELVPMVVGVPFEGDGYFPYNIETPRLDSMDLDNDGDLDLLWFGYMNLGNQVRATLNRTGVADVPRFGATYIQGRSNPLHVQTVDLDGDSVDEAIVTGGSLARVYDLSDGTSSLIVGSLGAFMSAMADLDGDGTQELMIAGNSAGLKMYSVEPDGTIAGTGVSFDGLDIPNPQAVVVADFDLDGRDDLAVTVASDTTVYILRGVEGGEGPGLAHWGVIDGTSSSYAIHPAVFDFTGDALPDLAIGDINEDLIRLYQNNSDGTFTMVGTIASQSPYWLIATDVDLDGHMDLVSTSTDRYLNIYFLDGAGQVDQWVELQGAEQMVEVIAEDFTGDSLPDLAVATSRFTVLNGPEPMVWEQTSPRVFELAAQLPTGAAPGIAATDANNDGAMDILTVSDFDRSLMIHWGSPASCPADLTGEGTLNFFDISAFLELFAANDPVGDFNGDGTWNFFDISAFLTAFAAGCP